MLIVILAAYVLAVVAIGQASPLSPLPTSCNDLARKHPGGQRARSEETRPPGAIAEGMYQLLILLRVQYDYDCDCECEYIDDYEK